MRQFTFAIVISLLGLAPALADEVDYEFRVDGLTCPFCAATSESALRRLDGVSSADTDLDAGIITVCARDDVEFTDDQLTDLFLDRGFTYRSMTRLETCGNTDS